MPKDDNCNAKSTFKPSSELHDSIYKGGEIWNVTFMSKMSLFVWNSQVYWVLDRWKYKVQD